MKLFRSNTVFGSFGVEKNEVSLMCWTCPARAAQCWLSAYLNNHYSHRGDDAERLSRGEGEGKREDGWLVHSLLASHWPIQSVLLSGSSCKFSWNWNNAQLLPLTGIQSNVSDSRLDKYSCIIHSWIHEWTCTDRPIAADSDMWQEFINTRPAVLRWTQHPFTPAQFHSVLSNFSSRIQLFSFSPPVLQGCGGKMLYSDG